MFIIRILYMDNSKEQIYTNDGLIKKLYDDVTYFDEYGTSIIIFLAVTILVFGIVVYYTIKIKIGEIKDDWANQRCHPNVIPIAGLINKPSDKSVVKFTEENFTYCLDNILTDGSLPTLQPLEFITNQLYSVYQGLGTDIVSSKEMINSINSNFTVFTRDIMNKLLNTVTPIQTFIIGVKDINSKFAGILTAALYTFLGSFETLQTLIGPISDVPRKCFDEDTLLVMDNGDKKKIKDIKVGDILLHNNEVVSTIQLSSNDTIMYNLYNIIVSGSHLVYHNNKWVCVVNHPNAVICDNYNKKYIYSLNVSHKLFIINNLCFSDWDEIMNITNIESLISKIKNIKKSHSHNIDYSFKKNDIHKYLEGGFSENTIINMRNGDSKSIKHVNVGDILENGENVYGKVEIKGDVPQYSYYLGKTIKFQGGDNQIIEYNNNIISTLNFTNHCKMKITNLYPKLYHLLTDKKYFYINNIKFYDYNSFIDF
jgi:hypothetical protein